MYRDAHMGHETMRLVHLTIVSLPQEIASIRSMQVSKIFEPKNLVRIFYYKYVEYLLPLFNFLKETMNFISFPTIIFG